MQGVWWERRKCIGCLECVEACLTGALQETPDGLVRNHDLCTVCGACVEVCPSQAMAFTGEEWTLDALLKRVLKDKDYYDTFGGGVTVSGGEPLGQYEFVTRFFQRLHEVGVHTALDTCGMAPAAALEATLPYVDAVLFDIKLLDPGLHKQYTGHSNEIILRNLRSVGDYIRQINSTIKLWIRTPLIPDATATPDNISAISRFISENLADVVERWELCAFNSACQQKYDNLGQTWTYADYSLMDQGFINILQDVALSTGTPPEKLVVSGLIAKPST